MDDVLKILDVGRQRIGHVVNTTLEVGDALQACDPIRRPAHEVVVVGELDRFAVRIVVIPVQNGLHEIIAEKPGATCDEQITARHREEFLLELFANVIKIHPDYVTCVFHITLQFFNDFQ